MLFKVFILISISGRVSGLLDSIGDQTLQQQLLELTTKVQELQQKVTALESNQALTSNGPVAFYAGLSHTLTSLGSEQHIVFDNVITNTGDAYKSSDGHFTAPVRGIYIFIVSLTNTPEHSSSAKLVKNGNWIGHLLAHGSANNSGLYVTSTLASAVQLEAGDEVWVQNDYSFSTVEQIDGGNWSCFTGHLVSAN